jgi:hypothetical protein
MLKPKRMRPVDRATPLPTIERHGHGHTVYYYASYDTQDDLSVMLAQKYERSAKERVMKKEVAERIAAGRQGPWRSRHCNVGSEIVVCPPFASSLIRKYFKKTHVRVTGREVPTSYLAWPDEKSRHNSQRSHKRDNV